MRSSPWSHRYGHISATSYITYPSAWSSILFHSTPIDLCFVSRWIDLCFRQLQIGEEDEDFLTEALTYITAQNVLYMAHNEAEEITHLDGELFIEEGIPSRAKAKLQQQGTFENENQSEWTDEAECPLLKHLLFVYSHIDQYTPLAMIEEFSKKYPSGRDAVAYATTPPTSSFHSQLKF